MGGGAAVWENLPGTLRWVESHYPEDETLPFLPSRAGQEKLSNLYVAVGQHSLW